MVSQTEKQGFIDQTNKYSEKTVKEFIEKTIFKKLIKQELNKDLDNLIKGYKILEYKENITIFEEESQETCLYMVFMGEVKIWHQKVFITTLGENEFFGEMAIIDKKLIRSASAIAGENCHILKIKGENFKAVTEDHSDIKLEILTKLSERMRRTNNKIAISSDEYKFKSIDYELNVLQKTREVHLRIFEQINVRASEVIASAERNTQSLLKAGTIFSVFITSIIGILGWIGFEEYRDIQDINTASEEIYKEVTEKNKKISEAKESIDNYLVKLTRQKDTFASLLKPLMIEFSESLNSNESNKSIEIFKKLPSTVLPEAFNRIEYKAILANRDKSDYTSLIYSIIQIRSSTEDRVRLYYILFANAILLDKDLKNNSIKLEDKNINFKNIEEKFKNLIKENKNESFHLNLEPIDQRFDQTSPEQKDKLVKIKNLIPKHWQSSDT